jgi:hypothetical protein
MENISHKNVIIYYFANIFVIKMQREWNIDVSIYQRYKTRYTIWNRELHICTVQIARNTKYFLSFALSDIINLHLTDFYPYMMTHVYKFISESNKLNFKYHYYLKISIDNANK